MSNGELRRRSTSNGILIVIALLVVGGFVAYRAWQIVDDQRKAGARYDRIAGYRDMSFLMWGTRYRQMYSGGGADDANVADIWLEIRGVGVYRLPEVTEEVISQVIECRPSFLDENIRMCSHGGTRFMFNQERRLIRVTLDYHPDDLFAIGAGPDGPFYRLPIDESTAHEVFGPPLEYRKRRNTRP